MGAFNGLDLTPKGRTKGPNETGGTISWVRLHDQYRAARAVLPRTLGPHHLAQLVGLVFLWDG
jgi:hypothetical protein